ncbi:metallophosphoesterase family protein [Calothrix sp. NIES-3974]|uniref:metallophosphoesterase family protein n=1 Tax=Calothrix sp. NIES-3974 TaxID=2005462 RepID=UPI000B5E0423|nr:metallophosphoesterase family protein [Calothrix sp. NIES-3974]BAZ06316.1 hypothetical protein NIES3974_29740 [Calothrix sp. NIES-3974]
MRWRFISRQISIIGCILGLCLVLILHACQAAPTPQPTPSPQTQQTSSPSLPAETVAILKSAGSGGVFNPKRGNVRFVVISDLNSAYGSTDYDPEVDKGVALIPFWQPDLVICAGDMVAGQKLSLTPAQIQAMWSAFDQRVAAPLRRLRIPLGLTIGNHDASGAFKTEGNFIFQTERDLASAYWNDPKHNPGVEFVDKFEFPFYYTFKYQDIFFLVWDGSSSRIPNDKWKWVEKTLASPAAQSAKMRILLGHLPLYAVAVGRNKPGDVMENADKIREMLEKYHVHTYISGHHHAYYPGHRGKLQLLHSGLLGSGPRPLVDQENRSPKTLTVVDIDFQKPQLTNYTTYDIRTLKVIKNQELPRFLMGHNGIVLRQDVKEQELTSQEKSLCTQRLNRQLCAA